MFKTTLAIARRELRSYFDSPVAYIVVVTFLLATGWIFFSSFFLNGRADMRMLFAPSPFSPSMLLVIMVPAITMRLLAEERHSGTLELLSTLPITDSQIVVGKFLAALGLLCTALAVTFVYPITVSMVGNLDWGPVISGYLGLILFSAALVAIGLWCSSTTDNQIVAFIIAFIISAALYFVYWLQFFMPQIIAPLVESISISFHLDNLSRGVVDSRDIIYYLSLIGGMLFLATQSLRKQHA